MTEDIMFGNIYVGHSVEDAQKLAKETFEVKHALEVAKAKEEDAKTDYPSPSDWKEDPVAFIRERVFSFIELAKIDPLLAFKSKPETGAALTGALLTLFGMLGALFGLVGGSQKPVTKVKGWVTSDGDGVLTGLFSLRKRPMRRPRTTKRRQRRLPSHLPAERSKLRGG